MIEAYSEKGEDGEWFTEGLKPRSKFKTLPMLVGIRNGWWRNDENFLVTIQGSAMFCKKMLSNLENIGGAPRDTLSRD